MTRSRRINKCWNLMQENRNKADKYNSYSPVKYEFMKEYIKLSRYWRLLIADTFLNKPSRRL